MLKIPNRASSFCIDFFESYLDDPEVNKSLIHFHSGIIRNGDEMSIQINTDHIKYFSEVDFQFQLFGDSEGLEIWCSYAILGENRTEWFRYQFNASGQETISGDMMKVKDWICDNFTNHLLREKVVIKCKISRAEVN